MFGRKCRILQRCFALFLMVCLLIPSVPVLAVTDTTENSETTEEVSLMTEEGNSSEERSRVLYDVSAIYENGEANTSHTLVDQTDATYGEILAEAGLTDALLSKNTTVLYYFVTETGNDITAYEEEGALYFKIWSDKASVCTMELGSLSTPDDRELQWGTVSLEAGWNEVILKMSSGAKQGNAMDLENVIRMRFFSLNQADTYLISDITIGQTAYLPGNTTGSAETDVAIAVDAIKSNLAVDDQGSYTIDVRVADSDTDAEVQQKIINALEESITAWTRNTDNIYNVEITVSCTEKENAIICAMMDEVKQ
ncbi:MAG: hypothetical protein J6C37_13120, partial [Roseburia sp.]|nr:hypothetical protein [Roseburia sp.]